MTTTYMTRADAELGEGLYDSIAWIYEVHIEQPDTHEFNFAVLHGNEDAPDKVELWRDEPDYDTPPDYVWRAA